ncbi:putative pectinesterase/pectinesterase inhibitor 46 [Capsicum chinense]|nr:putative pectinesterase/pectinesterase inhibitor 46 [Capsicum chinense]
MGAFLPAEALTLSSSPCVIELHSQRRLRYLPARFGLIYLISCVWSGIARDMEFCNTAGAAKHQAVALMSTADLSVFYRCKFDAYQDTLYQHSNRQFYRLCNIYGTVDFIFGNSAVVFQNCNILPKNPMPSQQNTITAQGKIDPNQNTGIAIQNCTVWPSANLTGVKPLHLSTDQSIIATHSR